MDTPLFDGELVHARRMIYTPSAFAKSNLVHLQEVGQLQARSPHASTRQGLASYLFFVVESGSGTLEYEGETRVLSAGDCVFLDCRRPYRHYTGDDLWQLRWAHFYGPNMAAIYKKYRERGGQPSFHPENTVPYTRRLEALYTLAASDNYVRDMQICEVLFALLTLLMQELDLHFAEKITLDALAERFYINKFYLTRVFKEQFGLSVTSYLTHLRITQAKRLLRFTDKSVENVAQECGLNDANYFSRLFKKVEGTTPGEYRRQW
ncbi:helix-turn-helix domain-containing protein [Gemmiger formicilis]|uniref:helix-turn-helix transcriptional regulator n=1 Tax=Gemmiger formicilis TaxID=745368 RepID=UPI003CCB5C7F